jgi:hypothetical protein
VAPAEPAPAAAVQFDGLADYVGLNAEAIEFDLVLPVVAGGHTLGQDGATGLDVLEEHDQSLARPGATRQQAQLVVSRLQTLDVRGRIPDR